MAVLIFVTPLLLEAQEAQQAATAGERAARDDTSKILWFGAGCLVGIIGLGAAFLYEPDPPSSDLMGKSDSYTAAYTDAYKEEAKSIQTKYALYGFGASCLFWVIYYVAVVAAFSSSTSTID